MAPILFVDPDSIKSVCCWYDVGSGPAKFLTVSSNRGELRTLLPRPPDDRVVFEANARIGRTNWRDFKRRKAKIAARFSPLVSRRLHSSLATPRTLL